MSRGEIRMPRATRIEMRLEEESAGCTQWMSGDQKTGACSTHDPIAVGCHLK